MKVVIPSAGLGSRVGRPTQFINKALLTVNHKPVIANIIEKFKSDTEFVIILGYKGDHIRQVLTAMYPDRKIKFITVGKFEGPGSGLGYTLLCAEHLLQEPFIFVSNDTFIPYDSIDLDPNEFGNWLGYYESNVTDTFDVLQYRTVELDSNNFVQHINPKGVNSSYIYVGVCGIFDYGKFWEAMHSENAITAGESYGLRTLSKISGILMDSWCDTGNELSLVKTKMSFSKSDINVLEKEDEAIWFNNGFVYKFSIDENFISDRVRRLVNLPHNLFPEITYHDKNLYVYKMVQGTVISLKLNSINLTEFLNHINDELWSNKFIISDELKEICYKFYKTKTYSRVNMFLNKFEVPDRSETINGLNTTSVFDLLNRVNWDYISSPNLAKYHGDFHNENILIDSEGKFTLIDWRQNFGDNNLDIGDIYYDFAKFYHGLIVSHNVVNNNQFSIDVNSDHVTFDILRLNSAIEAEIIFVNWLHLHGYDVKKTKILTALTFLNVAGLHEYPYSLFLYYLGKYLLTKWL